VKYIFLFQGSAFTYLTASFKSAIVNLFVLALSENIGIHTYTASAPYAKANFSFSISQAGSKSSRFFFIKLN
jgi:hypothetical protein